MEKSKTIRSAGIDMGTVNAAVTVIEYKHNKVKVLYADMLPTPILSMSKLSLDNTTDAFIVYFRWLLNTYRPHIVSPELFFQRSFRSNLASPISYCIGLMAIMAKRRGIVSRPVMPAEWKVELEKRITRVDNLYDMSFPIAQRLPPHVIDSLLIAIYNLPEKYKSVSKCELKKLIRRVKRSTTIQAALLKEKERVKEKARLARLKKQRRLKRKSKAKKK